MKLRLSVKPEWVTRFNKILGIIFILAIVPTVAAYFILGANEFVQKMMLVNTLISLWTAGTTHWGVSKATDAEIEASSS